MKFLPTRTFGSPPPPPSTHSDPLPWVTSSFSNPSLASPRRTSVWSHTQCQTFNIHSCMKTCTKTRVLILNIKNSGKTRYFLPVLRRWNTWLTISTSPILDLVFPKTICITFVSNFCRVIQSSQEKLKTMLMPNSGGQTRWIKKNPHVPKPVARLNHVRLNELNRFKRQWIPN